MIDELLQIAAQSLPSRKGRTNRVFTTAFIRKPVEQVFDYVTTPGNWPLWHPSSLNVSGDVNHSLVPGEQCVEQFHVAGRTGNVVWTVRERKAPYRWVIEGKIVGSKGGGIITYTLKPHDDGTNYEREFVYDVPSLLFAILDRLILHRRVLAESDEAVRRLKNILEVS